MKINQLIFFQPVLYFSSLSIAWFINSQEKHKFHNQITTKLVNIDTINLFQQTGNWEVRKIRERLAETGDIAAVWVALLHVLLRPGQPRNLTANVCATNISRNCRFRLIRIIQSNEGHSCLSSWIVEHLPEHARHGHLLCRSSDTQVQIHFIVVHIGESCTALGEKKWQSKSYSSISTRFGYEVIFQSYSSLKETILPNQGF